MVVNNKMASRKSEKKVCLTDEEKFCLIRLWEGEDVLYKSDNKDYHDNNKRIAAFPDVE